MFLQVGSEKVCLLSVQDKENLEKYAEGTDYLDLIQKVYIISVLAFTAGMKYTKEN